MSIILSGDGLLTQELVHSLFEYKDGQLFRKVAPRGFKVGQKVGCVGSNGYIMTKVKNRTIAVHRLVFLMQHGYLPENIDHINGNRSDNRIENLRPCTKTENAQNQKLRSSNTSGIKGVRWYKAHKTWQVSLRVSGKETHFGYYKDIELAELVAIEARDKYHGKFANYGVSL